MSPITFVEPADEQGSAMARVTVQVLVMLVEQHHTTTVKPELMRMRVECPE